MSGLTHTSVHVKKLVTFFPGVIMGHGPATEIAIRVRDLFDPDTAEVYPKGVFARLLTFIRRSAHTVLGAAYLLDILVALDTDQTDPEDARAAGMVLGAAEESFRVYCEKYDIESSSFASTIQVSFERAHSNLHHIIEIHRRRQARYGRDGPKLVEDNP